MATLGELIVRIGADARNFVKGLNDSTKQLNKWAKQADKSFGPVMDGIQTGLTAVGATAAVGFGALVAGSIKGASSLEGYRNTLNVVMKDQKKAAEVMAWAVDFANKTPFETDSVVQATVRLQSYGLEAQKVLPAVGDMAAVMNKDIMQAVEAVADAQTGELERLKEFGITKAMIVEQGNKIMRGVELVNNKGQIVDQDNFNKALLSLMDERYKGGMEIQANSLKGLWSTVTGVFKTTIATMAGISATGEVVAGGLFDKLKTQIKGVTDKLTEWENNGKLQEWADKAGQAMSAFWNVGEKVFNALLGSGKWIIDNWGLIGPILAGILAGFMAYRTVEGVLKAITIAQGVLNLVMAANPISLVILAIGALVAAGVYLYKNWDAVKAKALELWESINQTWENIKTSTYATWQGIRDTVLNYVSGTKTGIINGLNAAWDWIKSLPSQAVQWGADIMKAFARGITSIKIPVPTFSISLKKGPLGIKIPDLDIGINWQSLADFLPNFDKGGMVPGPIGSPRLAIVHGGEQVRTPGQQKSGGINIYITGNTISNTMDIDEIGDRLVRRLRREGALA